MTRGGRCRALVSSNVRGKRGKGPIESGRPSGAQPGLAEESMNPAQNGQSNAGAEVAVIAAPVRPQPSAQQSGSLAQISPISNASANVINRRTRGSINDALGCGSADNLSALPLLRFREQPASGSPARVRTGRRHHRAALQQRVVPLAARHVHDDV